ncbi:hypothetical protein CMI37_34040 [Candidatus Pacearchaeota archaeon]|nr:hypothetical protein [Candidatus Pacearchaeota archaeon]
MTIRNFNKTSSCEIDLRVEFDNIVFGVGGCKPHNHLVLLRKARRDSNDKLIKCACVSLLSDEADKESQCNYCLGERYIWDESFTRCYSSLVGADGGKGNRTKRVSPGEIRTDYKLFYLRYDEIISYRDKIIELALDIEGNVLVPYKRETIYRPETIEKHRADNGRVEYISVYCREDPSIRRNI